MKTKSLVLSLLVGAFFLVAFESSSHAQIPVIRNGRPVFRAPYFKPNGPQPFSTRRSRELAAQGNRGILNKVFSRSQTKSTVTQRPRLFSRFRR